jgi:hypothetical protein
VRVAAQLSPGAAERANHDFVVATFAEALAAAGDGARDGGQSGQGIALSGWEVGDDRGQFRVGGAHQAEHAVLAVIRVNFHRDQALAGIACHAGGPAHRRDEIDTERVLWIVLG